MDRYMIVIPAKNRAFNMKCDDGDSMKLETLQKLVGGPIEPVNSVLSAEWARSNTHWYPRSSDTFFTAL